KYMLTTYHPSLSLHDALPILHAMSDQLMANLGNDDGLYARPVIPGPNMEETYKDPGIPATATPAKLPTRLLDTTIEATRRLPLRSEEHTSELQSRENLVCRLL